MLPHGGLKRQQPWKGSFDQRRRKANYYLYLLMKIGEEMAAHLNFPDCSTTT
jgi:hypothetical protein